MNDEIKEIVVDNGELIAYYKNGSFIAFDTLLQEVLDYIINLQQENERLKDKNINEILKKDLEICAKQYKKSEEKLEKYKSRCEKAVEYIEEHITYECDDAFNGMQFYSHHLYNFSKDDLLNILNGRSDE